MMNDEAQRAAGVRKSYIDRTNDEDAKRVACETEVQKMERMEMELIKKLQQTQAIQKDAYQELEKAIKDPMAKTQTSDVAK